MATAWDATFRWEMIYITFTIICQGHLPIQAVHKCAWVKDMTHITRSTGQLVCLLVSRRDESSLFIPKGFGKV